MGRLPREGPKAWEAFCAYLDLGPARSLTILGQKLGKRTILLSEWSARWCWQARLSLYEQERAEMDRAADMERARTRAEIRRHIPDLTK